MEHTSLPSNLSGAEVNLSLVEGAVEAMRNAYAPYSSFSVGAALLCDSGKVFTGVNVENASYGAAICAERSCVAAAVSGGERGFVKIAIVCSENRPLTPCGICRQTLAEFSPGMEVLTAAAGSPGEIFVKKLEVLLPERFDLSG